MAKQPEPQPQEPKPLASPSDSPEPVVPLRKKRQRMVQAAFLDAFKRRGTIKSAAEDVGIDRDTVKKWRKFDKTFEARFQDADEDITEMLEQSAMQKAISPNGMIMNIFLLKARRPKIYGERLQHQHDIRTVADLVLDDPEAKKIEPKKADKKK